MKLSYLILLFSSFSIIGCSSAPTIHLNKLYLDEKSAKSIQSKLEKEGFNVEVNRHEYPADINSTSIVYSPFVNDSEIVDKVQNALSELDIEVNNVNSLVSSNHWYTKNTLGLFVVPKGITANSGTNTIDLAKVYRSSECETDIEINLKPNGTFSYVEDGNEKLKGVWSITGYPYILLEKKFPFLNYYFEVKKSETSDQIGKINITLLKPVSDNKLIEKCSVIYGVRV
ncbi:hypothetical protein [Thalassotalea sp. Y01]|uniref:hypothetical protein n=1 Tax=Thalassotalea sp. Y01 TaxID=2729613 RepID=UPI00145F5196|nr:hypothetical protein [Thalassotalea sp. Y01]NMP17085.1 hypothetical protein [Thalassotalea sp. Y01]